MITKRFAKALLMVLGLAGPLTAVAQGQTATQTTWKSQVETDWLRQADRIRGPAKLKTATVSAMKLAGATLSFVQQSAARPSLAAELEKLEEEVARAGTDADWKRLHLKVRWLRRRIIMSHPVLEFDRLLINKRSPPMVGVATHMVDQYLGRWSLPGPGLCVLESWKENPRCRELLSGKLPAGCVQRPDLSFDARRVIFSFCDHTAPGLQQWSDRPDLLLSTLNGFLFARLKRGPVPAGHRQYVRRMTQQIVKSGRRQFFIHELDLQTGKVRQLTGTAADPMLGADGRQTALIEDFDPCYLPGGGFVFISTRCQAFGRCHSGRYAPSYVLYRADADGSNIRRISFGEVNEWEPSVLNDGRIVFCRWDYINRNNQPWLSLWACRPDGTNVVHFYGNYTYNPCMVSEARTIPGSHKVVATACAHHCYTAGSIIVIDPEKGLDGPGPITRITPEVPFPETERWPRENYATPFPLSENLFLVAYAPDPLGWGVPAPRSNGYAIYLIDTLGGRELVYRDPEISCFSPIPITPRPEPPALPPLMKPGRREGVFVVQDVYRSRQDVEPRIKRGSVRGLRVIRIYPQPTPTRAYSSAVANEVVKGIVGTVPVEPDGSVAFRAPADVPLMFQLLDERGMAIMTMRSQVWVRPGEALGCVGCHEPRHTTSLTAPPAHVKVRQLNPPAGPQYEGGFSFARTVQPVLDRYCIRCHGLGKTEAGLNLLGTPTTRKHLDYEMGFGVAYESLIARPELIARLGHETYNYRRAYRQWVDAGVGNRALGPLSAYLRSQYMALARIRMADANSDGKLSHRETPALVRARFAAMDKSNDGYVDMIELHRAAAAARNGPDPIHGRWVALALTDIETTISQPRDYYAHASRLPWLLLGEHRKYVELDRKSFLCIVQWLDLNGQYYGDYSFNRPERRHPSAEAEKSLRRYVRTECGTCHATMVDQPLAALVNIALPQESRLLMASLAQEGGGWGLCKKEIWANRFAAKYQEMFKRVVEVTGRAETPDIADTCGREPCICGSCWVRKLRAAQPSPSGAGKQ